MRRKLRGLGCGLGLADFDLRSLGLVGAGVDFALGKLGSMNAGLLGELEVVSLSSLGELSREISGMTSVTKVFGVTSMEKKSSYFCVQ